MLALPRRVTTGTASPRPRSQPRAVGPGRGLLARCRGGDGERGVIGLAVLVPSLLVLVFGTINVAWWYHGRNVALAAAREGTAQGRVQGAGAAIAASTASGFAASTGRGILSAVAVSTAGSSATQVCVQVQARVPLFVPFLPTPAVTQHDCAPVEVFTP